MLQLGVCLPQAGAYMSRDTPEHPPDGTDPPGTPLMTKIRPKKYKVEKKRKKSSMNQ